MAAQIEAEAETEAEVAHEIIASLASLVVRVYGRARWLAPY